MSLAHALTIAAFVASLVLVLQVKARLFPVIALIVSGIELLFAFHIVHFGVRGLNLSLIFGAALAVCGGVLWMRTGGKAHVTCATVITLVGAIQLFSAIF